MARMRRGLVHAMAWSLATGAAVTLSWWGVHTVMAGTAYDPPRALPITADRPATTPPAVSPQVSSTRRPEASPTRSAPPPPASSAPTREPSATPSRRPSSAPSTPVSTGDVKSYTVDGGRAAFDIGASSAELVSATPAPGWQMQVWKQPTYIRVTFSRDGEETDVFCTWHDHAPAVRIEER
ncbi:hypothetical protein E2C00_05955 [Streptomyces sp. WAC05374]|uniref:hypothetical protein n=1 Tax=Streptomyces sp. WAC05374 TaxID=2487420 RepID=UPI000F86226B|nr:hypothetical protein [Streptomyces sp. WAC05374]RST11348.1 hypothetical protein EF905_25335 [Streptomyces sp. WAC05374]TDF44273.1 hypothetical protein E2B92_16290 [Streptomyces sp. WAC05374]TDF53797.1 hypothetical protein E2C02_18605 [Streptomyces sp. WAC05374]TDF58629.1 hypothetical protein E2C00_05955 [Streptomyces sp. WAC05374]